jgi:hypothetical protein
MCDGFKIPKIAERCKEVIPSEAGQWRMPEGEDQLLEVTGYISPLVILLD